MAGQEEIIQPDNVAEVWQYVAKPGDQPAESEDCPHLSPKKNQRMTDINLHQNTTVMCADGLLQTRNYLKWQLCYQIWNLKI